ncbi:2'-5' RNA ligase family protein [Aurantiacibacter spongiae]|uniref:2'-5' RNA ligase family protein n=1 Tax=Aurantiacibacter spongiae TaxID=2488860 RepID=UPI0015F2E912|nr:2'-5' RNA ligase family protein [Aurantiacibacter spongiae]
MTGAGGPAPLIVTALLPDDLQARANALRQAHFPPERNYLAAHVTLFHALPPSAEGEVRECLARMVRDHSPVPARLLGVMKLGKGTALRIESEGMIALWRELADRFHGLLTPQDEHRPRLHVTVQNKVSLEDAKALQAQLAPQIVPRDFAFAGLGLHAYRGGPWEHLKSFRFRG